MKQFEVYSLGICCASVCTDMGNKEATDLINSQCPTGIRSKWRISEDKTFASGEPHPFPCPHKKGCRHLLFNC